MIAVSAQSIANRVFQSAIAFSQATIEGNAIALTMSGFNLLGFRQAADTFFSDSRPIRLRFGTVEILPRPLVVYEQLKPGEDINSALSDPVPVNSYSVSIASTTLITLLGSVDAVATAVTPGSRWDVQHDGDPIGWRTCYVVGDPDLSGVVDYQFNLAQIALDEDANYDVLIETSLNPIAESPFITADQVDLNNDGFAIFWAQAIGQKLRRLTPAQLKILIGNQGASGSYFTRTFVNADLSIAGLLPVTHNLGFYPAGIQIWDPSGDPIGADDFTILSANAIAVDLRSFIPLLSGSYTIAISA